MMLESPIFPLLIPLHLHLAKPQRDLAPYVFRVAISDRRIVSCEDGQVTFSYSRNGSNRWWKMTVDALSSSGDSCNTSCPAAFRRSDITAY
jgi:hypothetical protein